MIRIRHYEWQLYVILIEDSVDH